MVDVTLFIYFSKDRIVDVGRNSYIVNGGSNYALTVWYKDKQGEVYVRTQTHFLQSFKPYEPVYEYQYACLFSIMDIACNFAADKTMISTSGAYYTDDEPKPKHWINCQRIDFTKRERK